LNVDSFALHAERRGIMGELSDKAAGKAKEVSGVVTGDRQLEAEGKRERVKGELKGRWEEAKQAIKNAFHREGHSE
jgi:uncharacterized protein YjbJ (UPF0337 family)